MGTDDDGQVDVADARAACGSRRRGGFEPTAGLLAGSHHQDQDILVSTEKTNHQAKRKSIVVDIKPVKTGNPARDDDEGSQAIENTGFD